ncbi:MAG: carbon-nitrogen hydrolase [Leptospirales bacterium]|nr:carbon-nitrogen hydrolase [Leptospirales bacterium]
MNAVRVALLQNEVAQDPAANLARTLDAMRAAAAGGAEIVCTQELFGTRYFCQSENPDNFNLAEPVPGPSCQKLQQLAAELQIVIVASLFERRLPGLYHNTAAIIESDGSLLGVYRKMHIPDDPEYYEKYYFAPGDLGYRVWNTSKGRLGVLICWDQWFPEAARATALAGAEILFYPTAIGWHSHERDSLGDTQRDAWRTMQRAHAIANGIYVCAVNRCGTEDRLQFWGGSFVADPFGRVVAEAGERDAQILYADLQPGVVELQRRDWPFLRDRRAESYAPLMQLATDL